MNIYDLDTPSLIVDIDVLKANLDKTAQLCKKYGKKLRPHTKTHKSPDFAKMQIKSGAKGITVAKTDEAIVMNENGIDDIFIAYPVLGDVKLKKLNKLLDRCAVYVGLDNKTVADGLAELGRRRREDVHIYLEIDSGLKRSGLVPEENIVIPFAEYLIGLKGVHLHGLYTHAGHAYKANSREEIKKIGTYEGRIVAEVASMIEDKLGHKIEEVSPGSTPTFPYAVKINGVTELRPGNYIFNDVKQINLGVAKISDCAQRVLVTVVSVPAENRAIIDAGSKTLSSDGLTKNGLPSYGMVPGREDLRIDRLNEEHGIIIADNGAVKLKVGQKLTMIPNHACTVSNLFDEFVVHSGEKVVDRIKVLARGKKQ